MRRSLLWLVVLAGCGKSDTGGPVVVAPPPAQTPEEAYRGFQQAVGRADKDAMWAFLSAGSKARVMNEETQREMEEMRRSEEQLARLAKTAGIPAAELKAMSAVDFTRAVVLGGMLQEQKAVSTDEVRGAKVTGNGAVVRVVRHNPGGDVELPYVLVQESGAWKLDLERTYSTWASLQVAKSQLLDFKLAINKFKIDTARLPDTLVDLVTRPAWAEEYPPGGYLEKVRKDPWGNDYRYVKPGPRGKDFEVISLGEDGREGGTGVDADLSCWGEE